MSSEAASGQLTSECSRVLRLNVEPLALQARCRISNGGEQRGRGSGGRGRGGSRSRGDDLAERRLWPGSRPPAPRVARAARKDWLAPFATTGTDYATPLSMRRVH